ncbi:TPA: hypothetical protein HA270_02200 [Candidatus Woesearchaeota archaeon]|nr:hypothetical protein [Candidatus Woesearchaeota archaeon]
MVIVHINGKPCRGGERQVSGKLAFPPNSSEKKALAMPPIASTANA